MVEAYEQLFVVRRSLPRLLIKSIQELVDFGDKWGTWPYLDHLKVGDKTDTDLEFLVSYRPISLLPNLSKILKTIILTRL